MSEEKATATPCDCGAHAGTVRERSGSTSPSRRDFLGTSLKAFGLGAGLPLFLRGTDLAWALNALTGTTTAHPGRILVVLELGGGNDGLNTVVPYTRDEYYALRPTLALPKNDVLKLSDELALHPNLLGWESLFKDGKLAIVHGCSYPDPNRSHFESMKFWHTGVPNAPESYGWVGRFADAYEPSGTSSFIVNVAREQSQAVLSQRHAAVVFEDPDRFLREGSDEQRAAFQELARKRQLDGNESLEYVRRISATASESSDFIRHACAEYKTKADFGYGSIGADLKRVAALIQADSPARIFYTAFSGFDTHASQSGTHSGLFNQVGDAVHAFYWDLERIGRADDVAVLLFTEFGRRVKENASRGTDHGVASPMFVFGKHVRGGFYSKHPSLTDLDEGDLKMTTDFRSVYATLIREWMGYDDARSILKGDYPTLGIFA